MDGNCARGCIGEKPGFLRKPGFYAVYTCTKNGDRTG
jgi:hypothetical protein